MLVLTRNSLYKFDLANKTVTRTQVTGLEMRGDHETVKLLDMEVPEVGQPLYMVIDLELPDPTVLCTTRTTSPVTEIL
jgi:hypothetical protein